MSPTMSIFLGIMIGFCACFLWLFFGKISQLHAEYELKIKQLEQDYQQKIITSQKRSVNTSRAVLKGKLAEQFAPILPEFPYLPSDCKFLGDPIDYIVFSGYSEFREGLISADELEVIFIDIKSGNARLTAGQQAIAKAIKQGKVRFETIRIEL